ncbi:MAG: hypothetical protein PHN85_04720 [Kiritimatiellae bacterium]|nr:hypothetical protein [Kiritimatiellia bacterium]
MKCLMVIAVLAGSFRVAAETWDFTSGCPEGWVDRREHGFQSKELYPFPEAFRFEATFVVQPDPSVKVCESVLWDDMYVNYKPKRNNRGLQVACLRRGTRWTPIAYAGMGDDTFRVTGPECDLKPGEEVRLALLFDANRGITWSFAGTAIESILPQAGGIAAAAHRPSVGDRVGSNYQPFEGTVRRISVVPVKREKVAFARHGRNAFESGETGAALTFIAMNNYDVALTELSVFMCTADASGTRLAEIGKEYGELAPGKSAMIAVPVETRLKAGPVTHEVLFSARGPEGPVQVKRSVCSGIGPGFAERMPTLMWMFAAPYQTLTDFGFTHATENVGFNFPLTKNSYIAESERKLDRALLSGVRFVKIFSPSKPGGSSEGQYERQRRDGTFSDASQPVLEVSDPDMVAHAEKVMEGNAKAFADHPAFVGILPCSEHRDHTFPSFNTEAQRYKAETGRNVPDEVSGKTLKRSLAEKRYPDGVVPTDDPILAYYRWFWKGGDGWPKFISAYADTARKVIKRPFFSFFDPAVRCPPVWGSGGSVDYLSQWIYATPEPMNVAGPLEELFAMARGRPGQKVMIMTQLICYRSQIAPENVKVDPEPDWVQRRPNAKFPTIPPDSLQEATWSMLAKPVKGIMYHGWGTIYETGEETGYCYTNPEAAERLRCLLKEVVAPLGPMLMKLGRDDSPVVILESATTALLGGPASWGWSAPAITFFQRARLDPRVIYEEQVMRDGFGNARIVYAPQCRFMTPDMIAKIRAFQSQGGVLVGDNEMLKALSPDVTVPVVSFKAPPKSDHTEDVEAMEAAQNGDGEKRAGTVRAKAKMLKDAEAARVALAAKGYAPYTDSSTPEIVVYNRRWKSTPYLFAINDKRTFGDYVGLWGLTMEKGLPISGSVSIADPDARIKAVYELSLGGALPFSRTGNRMIVPLEYETNDGRIIVFLAEPISKVTLSVPRQIRRGEKLDIAFNVLGASGLPIAALLPVEVRVYDATGCELDGAGWACAEDGVCCLAVQTKLNDPPGQYRIVCVDRASGFTATRKVKIQ